MFACLVFNQVILYLQRNILLMHAKSPDRELDSIVNRQNKPINMVIRPRIERRGNISNKVRSLDSRYWNSYYQNWGTLLTEVSLNVQII